MVLAVSYEPTRSLNLAEELTEYLGNFQGYIDRLRERKESALQGDAGSFETVSERADFEAKSEAAQNWLVARWGEHFPCSVCGNVEWTVSIVLPGPRPVGFLSFFITCGFCGHTMQVVPGKAFLASPIRLDPQLRLPEEDL